jgi:hypothetical protein
MLKFIVFLLFEIFGLFFELDKNSNVADKCIDLSRWPMWAKIDIIGRTSDP